MKPLLTALLIAVNCVCFAQKKDDSLFFATMKNYIVSIRPTNKDSINNLPFNAIKIIDARPDTTSIGFTKYSNTDRLILNKDFASVFTDYIHQHYNLSNDSNNLLIIVKEFRLSNYVKINTIKEDNATQWSGGCIINAELFLNNNNSFHALYKIDSLLIESSSHEAIADLIDESFKTIFNKAENKNLSQLHIGKTVFSFSEIHNHIADFSNISILKDNTYKKGVYKNFNEFKSDNPSITDFEINKGKYTDEILIKENGQYYPSQNFWGYCDGENIFIYSAKNLFKLIRTGNTFNTKAMKSFKDKYNKNVGNEVASSYLIGIPMSAMVKNNYAADINAFQLNMQTGELY